MVMTVLLGTRGDDEVPAGAPQVRTKRPVPRRADTAVLRPSSEETAEEGNGGGPSQDGARGHKMPQQVWSAGSSPVPGLDGPWTSRAGSLRPHVSRSVPRARIPQGPGPASSQTGCLGWEVHVEGEKRVVMSWPEGSGL